MVPDVDIPVLFRGGVERKLDGSSGLAMLTKLYTLQNMVFDEQDTVVQRQGTSSVALTAVGSSPVTVTGAERLLTRGDELLIEATSGLHRLVPGTGTTHVKPRLRYGDAAGNSRFLRAARTERAVSGNIERWLTGSPVPTKSTNYDHAQGNGVSVWAWEERDVNGVGRLSVRIMAVRESDGAVLLDSMRTSGTNPIRSNPRVIYAGSSFFIYYAKWSSGGVAYDIIRDEITAANGYAALSGEQTVVTNGSGAGGTVGGSLLLMPLFDLDLRGSSVGLVYRDHDTPTSVHLKVLDADGYTILGGDVCSAIAGTVTSLTAVMTADSNPDEFLFALFAYDGASSVQCARVANDGLYALDLDRVTVSSAPGAGNRIGRIVAYDQNYSGVDSFAVVYEYCSTAYASPPSSDTTIRVASAVSKSTGVATSSSDCFSGWFIHGRLAETLEPRMLLPVAALDPEGSSVFVVDIQHCFDNPGVQRPLVVSRVGEGEAGYIYNEWHRGMRVPACSLSGTGAVTIPFMRWVADVQVAGGALVTPTQLTRVDLDFTSQLGYVELNGLVLMAGACPHIYDGVAATEAGSHHRPYIHSATVGAGSDLPAAGTYYIVALQQWTDAKGNLWLGPPSNVVKVVAAGAAGVTFVTLVSAGQRAPDNLTYYRTKAGSTGPFYRMFDANGVGVTDAVMAPTAAFSLVPDTAYTTGASGEELPNEPCPAHRQACVWQGRIWLAGCDDGQTIYFSKEVEQQFGFEFSSELRRRVPHSWGRVVSVQPLGDRLLVLCERQVGQLFGSGPSTAGEQDNYSQVIPLLDGIGAQWGSPLSSISTPQGVWFLSEFGLRLVGLDGRIARGEAFELGAEVDSLITGNLIASRLGTGQQIRWVQSSGTALVFDYQWLQWSEFGSTAQWSSTGSATAAGIAYHLKGDTLLKYDTTLITDQGAAVTWVVSTKPLQLQGILGFQRVRRLYVLGRGPTADVTLTLRANYDHNDNATATLASAVAVTPESAYRMVFEHHLAQQKCEAIRLTIQGTTAGTVPLRLTGMKIRAGVKAKHTKLPAARRV